jgi:type I restriction enzyme M protein
VRGRANGQDRAQCALGIEAELFKAADELRGSMEPSDYKHAVLGLIFLKHHSDSFEAKRAELLVRRTASAAEAPSTLSGDAHERPPAFCAPM